MTFDQPFEMPDFMKRNLQLAFETKDKSILKYCQDLFWTYLKVGEI